jgi:hypothetical protein
LIGKGLARFIPVVGAVGVAGYAYFDTMQVAKTAIDLFQRDFELADAPSEAEPGSGESQDS